MFIFAPSTKRSSSGRVANKSNIDMVVPPMMIKQVLANKFVVLVIESQCSAALHAAPLHKAVLSGR